MSSNDAVLGYVAGFAVKQRPQPSSNSVHDHLLLNQLYIARGVASTQELDADLKALLPWQTLKGIDDAVALLMQARSAQWDVLIIGDYDTDGATATALAMLGLHALNVPCRYLLPNRFEYGYGLSPEIVDLALQQRPDLIITVDNGIASLDGVAKAKAAGVRVLVTDHHLPGAELPMADAIVNPNQAGCSFPSKAACGCTVLFYLLIAFRAALREQGERSLPNLAQWLDIIALATVADVVPLDANNRRLVHQGVQRIRAGQCRPGINALFEVAGKSIEYAKSSDLGFIVGPRLNAAGRLDDMTVGVQLLLAEEEAVAQPLAQRLHDLNRERRAIEQSMVVEAQQQLDQLAFETVPSALVLAQDSWHEGVIGILASRIKERWHRPVVAFAPASDGLLKGSARSIPGVHLRDALDWVAKQNPMLLRKFGGHAMAAGLTIEAKHLEEFRALMQSAVMALADPDVLTPHLWVDGELSERWLTVENAQAIELAGPWGQNFPEPSFFGRFEIADQRIVGDKHLKLRLRRAQQDVEAIAFNVDLADWPTSSSHLQAVYQLECNRFRGQERLQLLLQKIAPCNVDDVQ